MTDVAFVFIDKHNKYFAYVEGVCVGQVRRTRGDWTFFPAWSVENIFPPPQVFEINKACVARAALLNLTARMLK